jgi:hypothetical protein
VGGSLREVEMSRDNVTKALPGENKVQGTKAAFNKCLRPSVKPGSAGDTLPAALPVRRLTPKGRILRRLADTGAGSEA